MSLGTAIKKTPGVSTLPPRAIIRDKENPKRVNGGYR